MNPVWRGSVFLSDSIPSQPKAVFQTVVFTVVGSEGGQGPQEEEENTRFSRKHWSIVWQDLPLSEPEVGNQTRNLFT